MNRNRKLKKAVASTTAVVLSACMVAAPALTVDSAAPEKEETVYVNMDASGNVEKITVSDWLKNAAGSAELSDSSSLSDIKNVKGDETFTQDGEKLTWQADGSDIYNFNPNSVRHALPAQVHIGLRFRQHNFHPVYDTFSTECLMFFFTDTDIIFLCKRIHDIKSDIMSGMLILFPRISEPYDQKHVFLHFCIFYPQ